MSDRCSQCDHPRDTHGTRYATLPGWHTWADEPPSFKPQTTTAPAPTGSPDVSNTTWGWLIRGMR